MNRITVTLLALVLLLAPIFVAVPDTPDEFLWSSWLCAAVLVAVLFAVAQARKKPPVSGLNVVPHNGASKAFLLLLGMALCSIVARLLAQHSTAYLGLMLHGWGVLAVEFAVFLLCSRLAARSRALLYALLLTAVFASAIVAAWGTGEYLLRIVVGIYTARVYSTSTPDFLAGYLVLLLPVTAALFLGIPSASNPQAPISSALLRLLFGLIALMQTGVLLLTQSRFALVSFVVAAVVFLTAARVMRREETRPKTAIRRQLGSVVGLLLVCALFARPVMGRFAHLQDNSTAFRLWTWRGAARMAADNPILGTGIGAWVDLYPHYALTGFTRLAHNGYLQMADECGIPALLVLLMTLGLVAVTGRHGLSRKILVPETPASEALTAVASGDDRLLLAGLLSGLAASSAQNLADSDWYVFFLGITFWAFAGLVVGIVSRDTAEIQTPSLNRPKILMAGSFSTFLLALFVTQGTAALFGRMALSDDTPSAAAQDDSTAQAWDPRNAQYPADLGWRVYSRMGRLPDAEAEMRKAAALEPNGTDFRRLGTILDEEGDKTEALVAYTAGLRVDPNSLDLRLALAQDSLPSQALELYRQMAALEDSPVGRVRAIGLVTEVKFAIADAALGLAAANAERSADALRFDMRAQRLLESYVDEGGTMNAEQKALIGGHPAPDQDGRMCDLYVQVMAHLANLVPPAQKIALVNHAHDYQMRFLTVIAGGNFANGDFSAAEKSLESYADGNGSSDPQTNADMRDLYERVMDTQAHRLPPDQMVALQARRNDYRQKFARLVLPRQ